MNTNPNIYHRYLNLPFEHPKPERFNHPSQHFSIAFGPEQIYIPCKQWIESFGLTMSNVFEGFYTPPGGRLPLHTDLAMLPGLNDACKLNFTWGPSDSTTRWYKIKDESKFRSDASRQSNQNVYDTGIIPDIANMEALVAEWEDVDLVYEAVINRPSLMNVGQLHSSYNPSPTEYRWTLCYLLLKDGDHLNFHEAVDIFKNYIEE